MPSRSNQLTIIIIAYGWSRKKRDFFEQYPTIVIENNPEFSHAPLPSVQIVHNTLNGGFSKAANQGAGLSNTPFLLFLNDDCDISAEQIELLLDETIKQKLSAAAPTLVDTHLNIQPEYQQALPSFWSLLFAWTPLRHISKRPQTTHTLPGGCLLIQKAVLDQIGGWDERFWLWWEDSDLSYRLHHAGYAIALLPKLFVKHQGGETFSPFSAAWRRQVFFHSFRVFGKKHFTRWQSAILTAITLRFDAHASYPKDEKIMQTICISTDDMLTLRAHILDRSRVYAQSGNEVIILSQKNREPIIMHLLPSIIWITIDRERESVYAIAKSRARGKNTVFVELDDIGKEN